jgi:small conductance mechanosensitive channel
MEPNNELLAEANKLYDYALENGPKVIGAVIALVVGLWFVNRLIKIMQMRMNKSQVDESLQPFLLSLTNVLLKVFVILFSAGILGVQTASIVAVLGAAGFAVGLALQGSLGNFASGILILLFRPYKVGDRITVQNFTGDVREIQIFTTIIHTLDNRVVIIPNSTITSGPIENLSSAGERRLETQVSIHPKTDLAMVRELLEIAAKTSPGYLAENLIESPVLEVKPNAVILAFRYWVNPDLYEEAAAHAKESVHSAFKKAGIEPDEDDTMQVKMVN